MPNTPSHIGPADPIAQANTAAEAVIKKYDGHLPREVFEFVLSTIEANSAIAFNAARGISFLSCDARDIARQRRMNSMVDNGIIMLEELTTITICCTREEKVNSVPFPPRIDHNMTMLNFDNNR